MKPNNLIDELSSFLKSKGIDHISGHVPTGSKIAEFSCFDDNIKPLLLKQMETQYHRIIIGQRSKYTYYCNFQPLLTKTY